MPHHGDPSRVGALSAQLNDCALTFPEAWQDHPWEHTVVKVRKKIFVFLGSGDEQSPYSLGVKLPVSAEQALSMGAAPMGYGLGRHGWVTVGLRKPLLPYDILADWVEESYRAIAPKTLVARIPTDS